MHAVFQAPIVNECIEHETCRLSLRVISGAVEVQSPSLSEVFRLFLRVYFWSVEVQGLTRKDRIRPNAEIAVAPWWSAFQQITGFTRGEQFQGGTLILKLTQSLQNLLYIEATVEMLNTGSPQDLLRSS